jgi:hypothetical protein
LREAAPALAVFFVTLLTSEKDGPITRLTNEDGGRETRLRLPRLLSVETEAIVSGEPEAVLCSLNFGGLCCLG